MAGYLGSTPVPQATQHRESFTCTEGQTSFATAGYTPQFLDVFLNGSHLSPADFVATNGSDVVLGVAASADDVCDIISYTPFEVAGATFTGTTAVDVATVGGTLAVTGLTTLNGSPTTLQSTAPMVDFMETGVSNSSHRLRQNAGNFVIQKLSDDKNTATDNLVIDGAGFITMPLQPAFLAVPASDQNNFAVNSDVVVVFGTKKFDQGDNFASNTFTAPVTGKYQLNLTISLLNVDSASTYYYIALNTSNLYISAWIDPDYGQDSTQLSMSMSVLADMDASDTAVANVRQGSGTQQTDIDTFSYFSGYLVA